MTTPYTVTSGDPEGELSATVEIVDGAGHFLHVERPEAVKARILEFLS